MNKWSSFDEFIQALINNESEDNNITAESFNGLDLKNLQNNKPEMWKSFLDFLSKESQKLGHSPLLEQDLQNLDYNNPLLSTVFGYITQKADFNNENLPIKKIQDIITSQGLKIDLSAPGGFINGNDTPTNFYFWNESVSKLMAKYLNTLLGGIALDKDGKIVIPITDIKNADAGYLFGYQKKAPENEWVKPWSNIDQQVYQEVRGNDAINAVLSNDNNLQFTHSQDVHNRRMIKDENGNYIVVHENKWLRLIMPKYLRRVEIEDLNRNFWVISQVISAICAYLFGDNGLGGLLKDIINELMELWQNTIYLWAALAALSAKPKKVHELHKEVVLLSNNELQPYIKFDDFAREKTKLLDLPHSNDTEKLEIINKILPNLTYLKDAYVDSNIFALICVRDRNYTHNYYGRECYIGVYTVKYDEEEQQEEKIEIFNNYIDIDLIADFSNDGTQLNPLQNISHDIGAIKESDKSELNYIYYYPFSELGDNLALRLEDYHALLRTKIDIIVSDDLSDYTINFNLYDVSFILKQLNNTTLSNNINYNTIEEAALVRTLEITKDKNEINWTRPAIFEREAEALEIIVQLGYYLGELISCLPCLRKPPKFELTLYPQIGVPFYYPSFRVMDLIFSRSKDFVSQETYFAHGMIDDVYRDEINGDEILITKEEKYELDKQAYALLQDSPNILNIINLSHLNKDITNGGGTLSFLIMSHLCGLVMGKSTEGNPIIRKNVTVLANDLSGENLLDKLYDKNVIINNITDTLTNLQSDGGSAYTYGESKLFKKDKMNFDVSDEPDIITEVDCFGHYATDPLVPADDNIKYYGTISQGARSFTNSTQYCAAIIPDNTLRGKYWVCASGLEKGGSLAFQSGQYVYSYPDYTEYSTSAPIFADQAIQGGTISSDILYTINGDALDEGDGERSANWIIKRTTCCYTVVSKPKEYYSDDFVSKYCITQNDNSIIIITKVAVCYFAPPEMLEKSGGNIKKIQEGRMSYKIYDRFDIVNADDRVDISTLEKRWDKAYSNWENAEAEQKQSTAFYATVRGQDNSSEHMWAYYYPYDQQVEESPVNQNNTPNAYLYREFERLTTNTSISKAKYKIPNSIEVTDIKDFEQELFKDPMTAGGIINNE